MSVSVLSVHIPKCGGTSFRLWLNQVLGDDGLCFDYSRQWNQAEAGDLLSLAGNHAACIHGHIEPDVFDHTIPDVLKITWVRNPVERVISYYLHLQRDADMNNPLFREVIESGMGVYDFATLDWMRNGVLKFLKYNTEQFAFIGRLERIDEDMALCYQVLRGRLPQIAPSLGLPYENTAGVDQNKAQYLSDSRLKAHIEANHSDDMDFYRSLLVR